MQMTTETGAFAPTNTPEPSPHHIRFTVDAFINHEAVTHAYIADMDDQLPEWLRLELIDEIAQRWAVDYEHIYVRVK